MRGRKRAEDAFASFKKNGTVVVSVPGKPKLVSTRTAPIGASVWFVLHMLGLTAYDGETFLISAERVGERETAKKRRRRVR